jgi:hypothetical protein
VKGPGKPSQRYLEILNPRREDDFSRKGAETLSSEFYLKGFSRMKIYNFAPLHLGGSKISWTGSVKHFPGEYLKAISFAISHPSIPSVHSPTVIPAQAGIQVPFQIYSGDATSRRAGYSPAVIWLVA